jgi:uncharacterized membrane protein
MASSFSIPDFLGRWLFAAALVFGTYNPTQYSYVSWMTADTTEFGPIPALVSVALLIAWIVFIRAAFLSMGWLGIILSGALFACLAWLFIDLGWLNLQEGHTQTWIILTVVSLVLAVGMSWSIIRRSMSGQVSVDDVEDD